MGDFSLDNVNEMYMDVLKEIGNIGAGNATTALSQMLNQKMDMSVPKVELVPFNEISDIMGDEDQTVVGIMLGFEGDVYGMMMFLFDTKSATQKFLPETRRSRHTNVSFVDVTASRFSFMNDFESTTLPSRVLGS